MHILTNITFTMILKNNLEINGSRGEWRTGGPNHPLPLENPKAMGSISNTGLDPMENQISTKPAFNVGLSSALQRNAI